MSKAQNQTRALAALIESSTLTEAAEKAQISRKTLYGYIRNDPEFGEAYRAARDQITLEQLDTLNDAKGRATTLLLELMDDTEQAASIRLKAAQAILSAATKQHETSDKVNIAKSAFDLSSMF